MQIQQKQTKSIGELLSNLPQGVDVVLDIDETLVYNAVDKWGYYHMFLLEAC